MEEDAVNESAPATNDQKYLKEFIITLETLPEVWDSASPNCINKVKRTNAYQQLHEIDKNIKPTAIIIKDVVAKINSLKSNYRKEFKKIADSSRSGASTDDIYKPNSWVFQMLNFMNKTEQPTNTIKFSATEESLQAQEELGEEPSFSSINEPNPPPKKRKKKGPIARQNDLLEVAYDYLLKPSQPAPPAVPNIDPAAFYWSQRLEGLNSTQKLFAEKAINEILFEAELGTLNRNSIQINTFNQFVYPSSVTPANCAMNPPTPSVSYADSISVPSPSVESVPSPDNYVVISSQTNSVPYFTQNNNENTIASGVPSQLIITNMNTVQKRKVEGYNLPIPSTLEEGSNEYTAGMLFSAYQCENSDKVQYK